LERNRKIHNQAGKRVFSPRQKYSKFDKNYQFMYVDIEKDILMAELKPTLTHSGLPDGSFSNQKSKFV
jgi:hypothetical protein